MELIHEYLMYDIHTSDTWDIIAYIQLTLYAPICVWSTVLHKLIDTSSVFDVKLFYLTI